MVRIYEASRIDIAELTNLGCKLVDKVLKLRSDRTKINYIITAAISSKAHKLLVARNDRGKLVGAILVATDQFNFAEKMYGYITGIYYISKRVGKALIQKAMDWIMTRKAVQLVNYSMPVKTSVDKLLLKHDFVATGSMLIWRRYGIPK
ncbi:MAG: hypothetical protein GY746_08960 [Gammaproteobacteria bacterium]|nr:hypothetical protein [Gammaproteobacteria bacterium]